MAQITIDIVDNDVQGRAALLQGLQAVSFKVRAYGTRDLAHAMSAGPPRLLLARGQAGTPPVDMLLRELSELTFAWLPVVLLSTDDADRPYTQEFRSGVVDIWKGSSVPALAQRLGALVADLPDRPDAWHGSGPGKLLTSFLAHARKTMRTGQLTVKDKQGQEGQATLVLGVVRTSSYLGRAGPDALKALGVLNQAQLTFTQPQNSAEPGMVFSMEQQAEPVIEHQRSEQITASPAAPEPVVAATLDAGPATHEPVLLVDDDSDLRKLFSTFFGKRGYQVRTAEDGAAALVAATTELPGLVLADLNMPRIDGWALLRFLRDDVRTREVPVALFSCQDSYRESLRALQAGAQAFYPKTLRLDALERQIKELLEPRARFQRIISGQQSLTVDVGALGPAWVLRTLATLNFSGSLDASDGWSRIRVTFSRGMLTGVVAKAANQTVEGDPALAALLALKHAEGSFSFDPTAAMAARAETVQAALTRVLDVLAVQQANARATMLKDARGFDVHPELYALYLQVGPARLRDAARALCEARMAPREVAERAGLSLSEMEAFVFDLVRRGVMTLQS